MMPSLRIHTHCQVAQKNQHTEQNLSKSMAAQTHGLTVGIKHENTTQYIKHLADSADFKGGTFNKLCNGLIGNRFEMPNVSYTHPSEGIIDKIPNKVDGSIFSIYTNYQGDHTQPYDTILGCKVSSLEKIPEGMVGQTFEAGTYAKFISKGDLTKGVVYETWAEIWDKNLNRTFVADFEIYGEKAQNPVDAEVEVYVGLKSKNNV